MTTMGKDKKYPENRGINAIVILLATQGMIHLGEIADPLNRQKVLNRAGSEFFIDLLAELQRKTQGNLKSEESAFLDDTLENMRKVFLKKTGKGNG